MDSATVHIQKVARETLRVTMGSVSIEAAYYEQHAREVMVVVPNRGIRDGQPCLLDAAELETLERQLREKLGVRRWFGIPVGTRAVFVQRERHAS